MNGRQADVKDTGFWTTAYPIGFAFPLKKSKPIGNRPREDGLFYQWCGHWTPLHFAVFARDAAMIEVLVQAGADLNAVGAGSNSAQNIMAEGTPLTLIFRAADPALLRAILRQQSVIGMRDNYGRTVLHFAAISGTAVHIGDLITAGVPVDTRESMGATALTLAAAIGKHGNVKKLISVGADTDAPDSSGTTAIQAAAEKGHGAVVMAILETKNSPRGTNPLQKDERRRTLLHLLVLGYVWRLRKLMDGQISGILDDFTDTVEALLRSGVDPLARCEGRGSGRTAQQLAKGTARLCHILQQAEQRLGPFEQVCSHQISSA